MCVCAREVEREKESLFGAVTNIRRTRKLNTKASQQTKEYLLKGKRTTDLLVLTRPDQLLFTNYIFSLLKNKLF
jgi:hypothetical protein